VIQNPGLVNFWTGGLPLDPERPLVKYITTEYKPIEESGGGYRLLVRSRPASG
jgi:hypothetical protein